ncbi:MAG: O-antigen ligase family protein [Myxococcaceae bacterium]
MNAGALALAALVGIATVLAVLAGDGHVLLAFVPLIVAGLMWFTAKTPLRYPTLGLVALILCLNNPFEVPFSGLWTSPLHALEQVWFENLHKFTGVAVLRFSLLTVSIVALTLLGTLRQLRTGRREQGSAPLPLALKVSLGLSFATCVIWAGLGLARGGDFKQSLWQFQQLLFIPILCALFAYALRGPLDLPAIARIIVASAAFKVFTGAVFLYGFAKPRGLQPAYVTTHTDSLLFVVAFMVAACAWFEDPSRRNVRRCLWVLPLMTFGIAINDRRLAYVSLGACLALVFWIAPWNRAKRFVGRLLLWGLPLILSYTAVGWTARSRVFKPVQVFKSIVAAEELPGTVAASSTNFRELENFNLALTWRKSPFVGSGFGHEYDEVIRLPDISRYFPAYRYIPHNSVLWLWGIGGWVGFTGLTAFLVVAVLLIARAYRASRAPQDRAAALVALCIVVAYLNQAFGDMGAQSWAGTVLLSLAVVMGGKLAVVSGAWPAHELPRALRVPAHSGSVAEAA